MFELHAEKNQLNVLERELLTSGSVNVYPVRFTFSGAWDGLTKTAVFRAGDESRAVPLDGSGETTVIPWEVLQSAKWTLYAGVYGTRGGELVLPTVWTRLGEILEGAVPGELTRPPTPGLYEQLLEAVKGLENGIATDLTMEDGTLRLSANGVPLGEGVSMSGLAVDTATPEETAEMLDEVFSE